MSKTNSWETAMLNLLFANSNAANIGDATGLRGSTTAGSLYLSLHTADPGEAGDQTTSEVAYTSYARVAVARNGAAITVSGNAASLAALTSFPAGTGGSGTATHFGIGTAASGAGVLLYKGAISPTIVCGNGVTPQINAGTLVTED
ncbi:phage tail fiber protein [Variovorax saccharolyticus]|uniref:phage tail fiber protein n=1 Tax=Variovorax saccharolyticus TaxID=3053516 RepID=UPI0025767251|nr:hypothetical protein [Variovorax sp. J31P216]MDM0024083.1 hypothetical protein [Variovorax sp. J31P216]